MRKLFKTTLLTTAILGALSSAAIAQDTAPVAEVADTSYVFQDPVAKVNGRDVSKSEFDNFLYITQGIELGSVTSVEDKVLAKQLLELLGGQDLVSDAAKSRGLDQTEDHKMRLKVIGDLFLSQALLEDMIAKNEFPETDVKAVYEAEVAKVADQKEYQASHILVETQEDAQAILDAINKGETSFVEAAKDKSLDTATATRDGSLGGWFNANMMDPAFSEALVAMKKGEMSVAPVESSFGFHIILLDDVRDTPVVAFEDLDVGTKNQLINVLFQQKIQELQKDVKVELPAAKK